MTENQCLLTDPDKLGLLVCCREKMDELNLKQLQSYARTVITSLSSNHLKKLLFVGLNSIKEDLEYGSISKMNIAINKIIKKMKNKSKKQDCIDAEECYSIPKDASLSDVIPCDILGNNVCSFLIMRDIASLARCDRKFAIICHSPIAVTNIMHRHDPYPYNGEKSDMILIDGNYNWACFNEQRMRNVEKLSIYLGELKSAERLNIYDKVKDLEVHSYVADVMMCGYGPKPMSSLQTLSFNNLSCDELVSVLAFLMEYRDKGDAKQYFNQVMYQLTSVSFVDSYLNSLDDMDFDPNEEDDVWLFDEYANLFELILPSQPNNLQILRLTNAHFEETDLTENCIAVNKTLHLTIFQMMGWQRC